MGVNEKIQLYLERNTTSQSLCISINVMYSHVLLILSVSNSSFEQCADIEYAPVPTKSTTIPRDVSHLAADFAVVGLLSVRSASK